MEVLIIKTGALGDVLRTTSILPGLAARHPDLRVTWLTARAARDLVRLHPRVDETLCVDPNDPASVDEVRGVLAATDWDRVLSFDDEEPLCALASSLVGDAVLTGAYLDAEGERRYSPDCAPWFDMGLLSTFGKEEADRRKIANRETHPAILARMLGVEVGEPELPLPSAAVEFGRAFVERTGLRGAGPAIGLNTGSGGRWESKKLPIERTVALVRELERRFDQPRFLVLGGRDEAERNAALVSELGGTNVIDAGVDNSLLDFAALVSNLDLLVTSDSLALHIGVAQRIPIVAFFAPTSAAEIELYGRGEKVASTAPDYCTYRPDVDTSTLTVARLADAVSRVLAR